MEATDGVDARMVEAAARALCIENGEDPDDLEDADGEDAPAWTLHISNAEAVLAALQPFRDAEHAETRECGVIPEPTDKEENPMPDTPYFESLATFRSPDDGDPPESRLLRLTNDAIGRIALAGVLADGATTASEIDRARLCLQNARGLIEQAEAQLLGAVVQ